MPDKEVTRRNVLVAGGALGGAAVVAPAAAVPVGPGAVHGAATSVGARPKVVDIIPRRAWGALKPRSGRERHTPKRLTLHHSATALTDPRTAVEHVRSYQRWHMIEKGHPDVDYHFIVDRAGNIYEGRSLRFRGDTQTEYDPTGHFLVCADGDYEHQRPTRAQVAAIADLFAFAALKWGIRPRTLKGHRDYADTTCPGDRMYRLISDRSLRRKIKRRLARGGVELQYLTESAGRALVDQIENPG